MNTEPETDSLAALATRDIAGHNVTELRHAAVLLALQLRRRVVPLDPEALAVVSLAAPATLRYAAGRLRTSALALRTDDATPGDVYRADAYAAGADYLDRRVGSASARVFGRLSFAWAGRRRHMEAATCRA